MSMLVDWKILGAVISERLKILDKSVMDVVSATGISKSRLHDLLRGDIEDNMRKSNLLKILSFCGLSENDIPVRQPQATKQKVQYVPVDEVLDEIIRVVKKLDADSKQQALEQMEALHLYQSIKKKPKKTSLKPRQQNRRKPQARRKGGLYYFDPQILQEEKAITAAKKKKKQGGVDKKIG